MMYWKEGIRKLAALGRADAVLEAGYRPSICQLIAYLV
jgi:hypothetical protein